MSNLNLAEKNVNECQLRVDKLDTAVDKLYQEEVNTRKSIDMLLNDTSDDGLIKYQMQKEKLDAIKSKQIHLRQSTGVAGQALQDAEFSLSDIKCELEAIQLKVTIKQIHQDLPLKIKELAELAIDVLAMQAIISGSPVGILDINRIVRTENANYITDSSNRQQELLK